MSDVREITCDGCGGDLTYTGNCEDWRLALTVEALTPWFVREGLSGGAVTAMAVQRPITRSHHFHSLQCLDAWRADPKGGGGGK